MSRVWNGAWYREVSYARVAFLQHLMLLLFVFDMWRGVVRRGVGHGDGGFNVAHFAFLDTFPLPTPTLHLGAKLVAGFVALAMLFGGTNRLGFGLVAASYTYSWAMSRLDSYQHHYYLSLVLLCAVFMPHRGKDERGEAWAFQLVAATNGIMYLFAAITKLEPQWLSGATIRYIVEHGRLERVGLPTALHMALAIGAIVGEVVIMLGYFGRLRSPPLRRLMTLAWVVSLGLHIGIEVVGLHIGAFSFYMLIVATAFLAPSSWLAWSSRYRSSWRRLLDTATPRDPKLVILVLVIACLLLVVTGKLVQPDVRSAVPAAVGLSAAALIAGTLEQVKGEPGAPSRVLQGFVGALAGWWLTILLSPQVEASLFNLRGWL